MASKAALQQAAAYNVTADRVLGALEAIVFGPSDRASRSRFDRRAPRTVQRIVRTLERAQYVERLRRGGSVADTFHPTVRLLAMAAQLAPRLSLVQRGDEAAARLEAATEFAAYLAVPSYTDVAIIACSGRRGMTAVGSAPSARRRRRAGASRAPPRVASWPAARPAGHAGSGTFRGRSRAVTRWSSRPGLE